MPFFIPIAVAGYMVWKKKQEEARRKAAESEVDATEDGFASTTAEELLIDAPSLLVEADDQEPALVSSESEESKSTGSSSIHSISDTVKQWRPDHSTSFAAYEVSLEKRQQQFRELARASEAQ